MRKRKKYSASLREVLIDKSSNNYKVLINMIHVMRKYHLFYKSVGFEFLLY